MNFNVLIVEDEAIVLDTLVAIVEMFIQSEYPFLNLSTAKALNGYEALEIAKSINQDIILSDIVMPEMDGFEFIQEVRRFDKSVPILVLSALSSKDDINRIMNSGATNYTSKPLNEKIFIAQIRVFVDFYIHRQNRYNKKAVNLFSKKIYKRKTEFYIEKENDLLEFWEFVIRDGMDAYKIDSALQYIYDVEYLMIKKGITNTIVLEENDTYYYITVSNMNEIEDKYLQNLATHHFIDETNHKNDGFFDSFLVQKKLLQENRTEEEIENNLQVVVEESLLNSTEKLEELEKELKSTLLKDIRYSIHEAITPEVFLAELDPSYEDKIENFLDDLSLVNVSIYNLEESDNYEDTKFAIDEIVSYIYNFDVVVESMGLFNVISRAFAILINFLENIDRALIEESQKRILLAGMLFSVTKDLEEWIVSLFLERNAKDIHYFDASFSDNCLTIISTFLNEDGNEDETDDEDSLEFF